MSANPIIYCLENLTDYRQFERLSSDLMSGCGFLNVEPIGGSNDRGRDAIYTTKTNDVFTIFAYTVRSDWSVKLNQDCKRIKEEHHNPDQVVFVCTSDLSGNEKDKAKKKIKDVFNWDLEIYDIERIRVLLAGELRHLIAQHPAIFCPPWFPVKGGLSIAECRDTIIIDHLQPDHSLATWLSRKLSIAGYKTWCYGLSPLAGEDKDESISSLIDQRAVQYLPILSYDFFSDSEFVARLSMAAKADGFVIPCWSDDLSEAASNAKILKLEPAKFDEMWSGGLSQIIEQLNARAIKPDFDEARGKSIALKAYMPEPVTRPISEKVYSNVFAVDVPKSILVCELDKKLHDVELEQLRSEWAFAKVSPQKLLSFDVPPASVPLIKAPRIAEYAWESYREKEGRNSVSVVKELIRRSLFLACSKAGLEYCEDRKLYYFKELESKNNNISFIHVDGRKTHVAGTGIKQDGWGDRATKFRYQLSPSFRVDRDEEGRFWVMTRIYIRVTDLNGKPYEGKEILRKRKKVTKSWWNKEWLARTLGVMQALSKTEDKTLINIGSEKKRTVSVSTRPLDWDCPVSIDVEAVDRIGDFQEEMASSRYFEESDIEDAGKEKEASNE
ncbi:hypothetical protein [Oceanobacter antarcticus]|uniref:TIR domain-containing protein n=1 Tax=Oceanobacter antarcticus TaxID=3133425 RepID=A0ABW8NDV6_9GAMM